MTRLGELSRTNGTKAVESAVMPAESGHGYSTVEDAIEEVQAGRFVVVVDAGERENEGDLVIAAQFCTPEALAFMARRARGLICLSLTEDRCRQLGLEQMNRDNKSLYRTAFTVSVDARQGVTTGISAADRARTIQVAIDPARGPQDLVTPGHVFPLEAASGGVLERQGHTEAAIDLVRLAGLQQAAVLCEIMNDDGTMARNADLIQYCRRFGLTMIQVKDVIEYRHRHELLLERAATARLPTPDGEYVALAYREMYSDRQHLALVKGSADKVEGLLVRVHSGCLTGDVFSSLRCDCGAQLRESVAQIDHEGRGVIIYLAQEGRGLGLANKIRAYSLQEAGFDTVDANLHLGLPADARDYWAAGQILADLGVSSIRLLTNNPQKVSQLNEFGRVRVMERLPLEIPWNRENARYMEAKRNKLGHDLKYCKGMNGVLHHAGSGVTSLAPRRCDSCAVTLKFTKQRTRRAKHGYF